MKKISKLIIIGLIGATLFNSCATIIHPERRGNSGELAAMDPWMALLDTILILFGIAPGVIAWAVDITTGAIYMGGHRRASLDNVDVNSPLYKEQMMAIISNETGAKITGEPVLVDKLNDGKIQVYTLQTY